jgi:hypothetical protein
MQKAKYRSSRQDAVRFCDFLQKFRNQSFNFLKKTVVDTPFGLANQKCIKNLWP